MLIIKSMYLYFFRRFEHPQSRRRPTHIRLSAEKMSNEHRYLRTHARAYGRTRTRARTRSGTNAHLRVSYFGNVWQKNSNLLQLFHRHRVEFESHALPRCLLHQSCQTE